MTRISVALRLGLAVFLAASVLRVRAEGGDDDSEIFDDDEVEVFDDEELEIDLEEDDDGELGPSPDIETAVFFPDYSPDNKLEIGEVIKMAFVVSNKGDEMYNVTAVFGALRSPYDYGYHIQNLSAMPAGVLVPPNEQASVEYYFMTDPRLEPEEFWMSAEILYNSTLTNRTYISTVFNQTLELVAKNKGTDYVQILKYIVGIALVALCVNLYQNSDKRSPLDLIGAGSAIKPAKLEDFPEEKFALRKQERGSDGKVRQRVAGRKNKKGKGSKKKGKGGSKNKSASAE